MRYTAFLVLITMALSSGSLAQDKVPPEIDSTISAITHDFIEAQYTGDVNAIEKTMYPDIQKMVLIANQQTQTMGIDQPTYSQIVEATRAKIFELSKSEQNIKVSILKINQILACVKYESAIFSAYTILIYFNGDGWKIANELTTGGTMIQPIPSDFNAESEKASVKYTVTEFIESLYSGDIPRVKNVIYPELVNMSLGFLPQTKRFFFTKQRVNALIDAMNAKATIPPEEMRSYNIQVLDVMPDIAFVELETVPTFDYLQLAKIGGQWKVVNLFSIRNFSGRR